jgi:hypothetical protein
MWRSWSRKMNIKVLGVVGVRAEGVLDCGGEQR